jgi:hypothetical protein
MPSLTDSVVLVAGAKGGLGAHVTGPAAARRVTDVPEIPAGRTGRRVNAGLGGERS